MLPKINVYATLAALLLFFLPWFCLLAGEGIGIVTQSGIGATYGSVSIVRAPDGTTDPHFAPLVIVALLATVFAALQALSAFRDGRLSLRVGLATGVALVCLLAQTQTGFPLQKESARALHDSLYPYAPVVAPILPGLFDIKTATGYLRPFYLELAVLAIPTLILFDALLNMLKRRKS